MALNALKLKSDNSEVEIPPHQKEVTVLLSDVSSGNRDTIDRLLQLVYDELRRIAHGQLRRERDGHTLNTTALVHEAYLNLVGQQRVEWQNRSHFFGVAAQAMRRILVNYARNRRALKRGGGEIAASLDDVGEVMSEERAEELVNLDEALIRLSQIDERKSRIVECRYFAGLSIAETAEVIGLSPATVKREWTLAKAWLFRELGQS